jgi:hypothetical protein
MFAFDFFMLKILKSLAMILVCWLIEREKEINFSILILTIEHICLQQKNY